MKLCAEPAGGRGERGIRQGDDRALFDRRPKAVRRRRPRLLLGLAVVDAGVDGVSEHDDVAGAA